MPKPVIVAVDDDPEVLRSVDRDLRQRYGSQYRIMRADSGQAALDLLEKLKARADAVALLLADQRMPGLSGVEYLDQARVIFPDAKRALLTAYADTEAAIQAINRVKIDYYLMKPWDPPDEHLYPVLTDLLDDWSSGYQPPFEGIRLIGHRWSPETHRLKEFLARNQVPFRWLDVESNLDAQSLVLVSRLTNPTFPLVSFPDGTVFTAPTEAEVAQKIGLRKEAEMPFYDLVIIGAGPAGLAAGVYGASEGLRTLLIERHAPGGQAGTSSRIENYLGFPVGLSGGDLARRAVAQARRLGVEILAPEEVVAIQDVSPYRSVSLKDGRSINCYAVLIATGVSYCPLDVPGVHRLTGAGVYYGAAMTEAISCQGEAVFIVGGANSAGQAAMYFSKYACTVTMLVRGNSLEQRMSQYLVDQIRSTPNIVVRLNTAVVGVDGEQNLESVTLSDLKTGSREVLPARALFIFIGAVPQTDWLGTTVARDPRGFILAGPDITGNGTRPAGWKRDPFLLETSLPGVFVAGDVCANSIKRVASAVGQGSIAIQFIHQYLSLVK
ncbi:MAG TPA: FAD-dependent oxidoreductase [Acidobacteriota bacterium]|nr:FAD-dependent oxidoreductase [Acidobacteriota bacterium]